MNFEVHITVDYANFHTPRDWNNWCEKRKIKPLRIQLIKGKHEDQLMCAVPFKALGFETATELLDELKYDIAQEFHIDRVKLEGALHEWNGHAPFEYAETHLKCLLRPDQVQTLIALAPDSVGVSESIWGSPKGFRKMYLTERVYPEDYVDDITTFKVAKSRFYSLYQLWEPMVTKYENEIVYTDTNPNYDQGWFTKELAA